MSLATRSREQRVAVAGLTPAAGLIALERLSRQPQLQLAAWSAHDHERHRAQGLGQATFPGADDLLAFDPTVLLVDLASPGTSDLVAAALRQRCPVLLLGGPSPTRSTWRAWSQLASTANVRLAMPWSPGSGRDFHQARQVLRAGRLGALQRLACEMHVAMITPPPVAAWDLLDPRLLHLAQLVSLAGPPRERHIISHSTGYSLLGRSPQAAAVLLSIETAARASTDPAWRLDGERATYWHERVYSREPDGEIIDEALSPISPCDWTAWVLGTGEDDFTLSQTAEVLLLMEAIVAASGDSSIDDLATG